MFAKIFLLVKNNAGMAVIDNPVIAEKHQDAVITEASSAIIEVLKSQVENGKLKDVLKYFQYPGIYQSPLVASVSKKFANRLNKFYGIEPDEAIDVAQKLIPVVMKQLADELQNGQDNDFSLMGFLTMLTGNRTDMGMLVNKLVTA